MATSYHARIYQGEVVVTASTDRGAQSAPTAAEAVKGLKGHRASHRDEYLQQIADEKARRLREAVRLLGPSLSLPVGHGLQFELFGLGVYLVKGRTALLLDEHDDIEEAAHAVLKWRDVLRSMP